MIGKRLRKGSDTPALTVPRALLAELRDLIATARTGLSYVVNASLTMLHWRAEDRIRREILKEKRAGYGTGIVSALPRQLEPEFGRGFSAKSLRHMVRFAEVLPDARILSTLLRELSWRDFLSGVQLEYLTALPPRELLGQCLDEAVQSARARMAPERAVARVVRKTRRKG